MSQTDSRRGKEGYTAFPHTLTDFLCRLDLSGQEFRILLRLVRLTTGHQRETVTTTKADLARSVSLNRDRANKVIAQLAARGLVHVRQVGTRMFEITPILQESTSGEKRPVIKDGKPVPGAFYG